MRKKSKKKTREVGKLARNLPATPELFTAIKLYQALQKLHYQGEYSLAVKICNAMLGK